MAVIEVEQLCVAYGSKVAVEEVSFEVGPGEVLALLGPNGAGKTSTVEAIEGYRATRSGRLRVLGLDPRRDHARLVPRIGVMLQRGGVYPVMSPARLLKLFASYYPRARQPEELIELLGLGAVATTPFKRLSGGEQQRVLLALALVGLPEVCFLDEPTAGVDPAGRVIVRDVIASLRESGTAILLTSHELDEVERLADRVVIVDRGRVLAKGSPGELAGAQEIRFSVRAPLDADRLSAALGAVVVAESSSSYRVAGTAEPAVVAKLTALLAEQKAELTDLRLGRERLEDVFLRLVRGEER